MAQNLFEKYGIKEVADVTLYRIERKDETYESQRKISISSILKGALTKEMVYPLDEDGKGEADGYEAYVFKDADVLSHFNYDCDDIVNIKGTALIVDNEPLISEDQWKTINPEPKAGDDLTNITVPVPNGDETDNVEIGKILSGYLNANDYGGENDKVPNLFDAPNVTVLSAIETSSNRNVIDRVGAWLVNGYEVTKVAISDANGSVTYNGRTEGQTTDTYNIAELDVWKSYLVAPVEYDLITFTEIVDAVGKNGKIYIEGDSELVAVKIVEVDGEKKVYTDEETPKEVTDTTPVISEGSYITFTTPANADPATIMARFALIQQGLYESIGVIVRFTQPVKVSAATETTFSGTIKVTAEVPAAVDEDEPVSTTFSIIFEDVVLEDVTGLAEIINAAKEGSLTVAQVNQLIGYAATVTGISLNPATTEALDVTATVTSVTVTEDLGYNIFLVYFTATLSATEELKTGRYDLGIGADAGHYHMDIDGPIGTHEFTYPEQVCMLYAKNQDLITKAGTRYQFANPDQLFGNFEFDDNFATAPNGKERVVVVGLVGRISENLYDLEEVDAAIKELTDTIEAKAYDITYTDYAELVVEDEMGYYLPQQLGAAYDKKTKAVTFFGANGYAAWAKNRKGIDPGIQSAINTWGDDTHYSINDAIDALKQQSKLIDAGAEFSNTGFTRVFGGYKVTGGETATAELPLDDIGRGLQYEDYTINGAVINSLISGEKLSSAYNLDAVLNALAVADLKGQVGEIRITSTAQMESNRAIYVDAENGILSNRAFIYLLKNVNARSIATDNQGVFEFYDKKGNRLYYQDKVFAGTAYLALVVIGTYGLIFVVNRHCTKNVTKTAWMINDGGYITDKQAERLVKNGLIHTVSITECDETFDATCTVGSIKVRKTKKNVLRYVPVLFLDTLKVSTIEQAAETTDATGGRGNAKLITWDYGKDITLTIEDALYTPASMAAIWAGEHGDLKNGVKDTHVIDRMEKITAKRSFIVPAGNQEGVPSEGNNTAQAVYIDPKTMDPFQDGTPIAEGEVVYKWTRSVAYDGNSIGNTIEVSADGFPGTYRVVGETMVRDKVTGEDQRFQFIIPEAKMSAESTSITLEADGDPVVFDFTMDVLRPENGIMMKFVQFDVEENTEENDGSTMVKDTENLNLLDDAEMYKVSGEDDEELIIGATEY